MDGPVLLSNQKNFIFPELRRVSRQARTSGEKCWKPSVCLVLFSSESSEIWFGNPCRQKTETSSKYNNTGTKSVDNILTKIVVVDVPCFYFNFIFFTGADIYVIMRKKVYKR